MSFFTLKSPQTPQRPGSDIQESTEAGAAAICQATDVPGNVQGLMATNGPKDVCNLASDC